MFHKRKVFLVYVLSVYDLSIFAVLQSFYRTHCINDQLLLDAHLDDMQVLFLIAVA